MSNRLDGQQRLNWRIAAVAIVVCCGAACGAATTVGAQQQGSWTLEQSLQRALEVAPEARGAQADVSAKRGALQQAGAWPNPQIELRADDKIGKDQGNGGIDFTQFALSQSLPLSGRLGHQQAIARAQLEAAQAERRYQLVRLETQVAQGYHNLQLATERMRLAQQRLQLAEESLGIGVRHAEAGELSHLEHLRVVLFRESAQQNLDKSEGAYNEALSRFSAYLDLAPQAVPQLAPLIPFDAIPVYEQLEADLGNHVALLAARQRVEAARADVRLARAERFPDPDLRFFRERDLLNDRRQDVTGIGIGVAVPLWDRNSGRINESRAEIIKVESELQVLERDLGSRMRQSYLHLDHLVQQGEHYRERLFTPAREVFDLTRNAYANGEADIHALTDANNVYFDAHERYLELLQEAWLEAAELRLAVGHALVTVNRSGGDE